MEEYKIKDYKSGQKIPYKLVPRRAGNIATCYSNPQKAKEILGWEPKCTLEELCSMMVKEDLRRNEIGFSF